MFQGSFKSVVFACALCGCLLPTAAAANDAWQQRFTEAVLKHPDIQAAQASLQAELAQAKVLESPIYNPELEAELESEGSDTNFRVDVSQPLDWWDRGRVFTQQAKSIRAIARSRYQHQVQQLYADALRALAQYESAQQAMALSREQEDQQRQILQLVEQRQQAGDLGLVDTELAHLDLIRKIAESARANVELIRTKAELGKVLPGFSPPFTIPDEMWQHLDQLAQQPQDDQWVQKHPVVEQAKAQWHEQKNRAQLSRLKAKAEPAVGIGAGRSGDDNVFALTLSIPLNLRNNFGGNIEAANQAATSAQAEYLAATRKQLAEIQATTQVLQQYAERYAQWKNLMAEGKSRNAALLERLWNAGELSTTEYLSIRQQASEAMAAGIELKAGYDLARIDWLIQSGHTQTLFHSSND